MPGAVQHPGAADRHGRRSEVSGPHAGSPPNGRGQKPPTVSCAASLSAVLRCRQVSVIDMALLTELCPQANTHSTANSEQWRLWRRRRRPEARLAPSVPADQAGWLVDTNGFAASRASPLRLLARDETAETVRLYPPQVINHARAVLCTVALVQMAQTLTGKTRAVGAEASASYLASLDLAGNAGLAFSVVIASAARTAIPAAQKGVAEAAIHAAGGDQSGRA
jgi:hypothetical protein